MKKLFLAFFMAVATVSFMTGCDKENDDELTDGTEQTDGTDSEEPGGDETDGPEDPAEEVTIVGSWVLAGMIFDYQPGVEQPPYDWTLNFYDDGTYIEGMYGDPEWSVGTYTYDAEAQAVYTYEDGRESNKYTYEILELTDSKFVAYSSSEMATFTFTRQ